MIILVAGKHAGKTIEEIWEKDPKYLFFLVETVKNKVYPLDAIKEFIAPRRAAFEEKEKVLKEKRKSLYKPLIDGIKGVMIKRGLNNKGVQFFANMLKHLEAGDLLWENAALILCDNVAKSKGRRNSNAYKQAYEKYTAVMEAVRLQDI